MQQFRCLLTALCASLALAATPLWAAEADNGPALSRQGDLLALDALDQRLALPMPDWLAGNVDIEALRVAPETVYQAGEKEVTLLLYPRAESEAFWTTRVGARISVADDPNLKAYRDVLIIGYAQICRPELTAFFQLSQDRGEDLAPLGFACGGYIDRLNGYEGKGEVMVMRFVKTARGVGVVYQEWLGAGFDPADPAGWPVDPALVERRVTQFDTEITLALLD